MSRHAVVLGASITGMLTARVLAERFERVTVIERKVIDSERSIAPQADQFHILLGSGLRALDQLFPGFEQSLVDAGGVKTSATADWHLMFTQGWLQRFESSLHVVCSSRHLLERLLRERCRHERISWRDQTQVTGVRLHEEESPVVYTQLRHSGLQHEVRADLLVDCTGMNSKANQWLRDCGFEAAKEEEVASYLGYACQRFKGVKLPEGCVAALVTPKAPKYPVGGAIMPIEGDQWMVAQYGFAKQYPSTDQDVFMAEFSRLRNPIITDALKDAKSVSLLKGFRKERNVFRYFHKLRRWPKGFLVNGDALASLNPYYGQGMSTAAVATKALAEGLAKGSFTAQKMQKRLGGIYHAPWVASTTEDLRWPTTETSAQVPGLSVAHRLSDRLVRAATRNTKACEAFLHAMHMTKPASSVFRLPVLWAMMRYGRMSKGV